jgi:xanthine dehydrogenase accessory factor
MQVLFHLSKFSINTLPQSRFLSNQQPASPLGKQWQPLIPDEKFGTLQGMPDLYEEIVRLRNEGKNGALAIVVNASVASPGRTNFKMLVYPDGQILGTVGGGKLEASVMEEALKTIQDGQPRMRHFELKEEDRQGIGVLCGGEADVYIEPVGPPPSLYLFGGGHIGQSIGAKIEDLDFRLVVVDDREQFANRERFPGAEEVRAQEYFQAMSEIQYRPTDYVVIVTKGHSGDEVVLAETLKKSPQPAYIGMIGSKAKVAKVIQHLRAAGIPEERLRSIHAPIGLDIGGERPGEIAISILAQIIAHRHGKLASE